MLQSRKKDVQRKEYKQRLREVTWLRAVVTCLVTPRGSSRVKEARERQQCRSQSE